MAEEAVATTGAEEPQTGGAQAAPADGFTPITSQEQLNAVLKDRLARERGKVRERYADYDELKERAGAAERLRADLDAANARADVRIPCLLSRWSSESPARTTCSTIKTVTRLKRPLVV